MSSSVTFSSLVSEHVLTRQEKRMLKRLRHDSLPNRLDPGLLQTPAYARWVIRASCSDAADEVIEQESGRPDP
jgi:hypothetical protein